LGLFRADFSSPNVRGEPTWITWIDAKGTQPDFHVAGSFGVGRLAPDPFVAENCRNMTTGRKFTHNIGLASRQRRMRQ
jgi:hypothetical protein